MNQWLNNNHLPKQLESKMKIRFHDCDPFNHLNNSRYIDYMMTARGDQLIDHYNFDIYSIAREEQLGWVSAFTQVAYLQPATVMEEVVIQTALLNFSPKTLLLEALMWSHDKRTLKAGMWVRLVHFNLTTNKSQEHTAALIDFFKRVVNPLPVECTLEQRINTLQNKT